MEIFRQYEPYRIFINDSKQVVIEQVNPYGDDAVVGFDPLQVNQLIKDLKTITKKVMEVGDECRVD